MILMKEEHIVESERNRYRLIEISNVWGLPDHERKLFLVINEITGTKHYKGLSISGTNLVVSKNNGISEESLWNQMIDNTVERFLREDDERNIEIVFGDKYSVKGLNPEDGSYLPEIISNVRVGNLANEYSQIPGGKN